MLRPLLLSLLIATPASAYLIEVPFDPIGERAQVTGPYDRYSPHILKLSARKYAVMFKPGFVDSIAAVRAVQPLCAAQGRQAQGVGTVAPADIVIEQGEPGVLQGYRVECK